MYIFAEVFDIFFRVNTEEKDSHYFPDTAILNVLTYIEYAQHYALITTSLFLILFCLAHNALPIFSC
jgi:hypothetical protein